MFDQAVREALDAPGCAVCLLVAEQSEHFLHWYATDTFHTPELMEALDAGPFCRRHAERIVQLMGIDIGGPLAHVIEKERQRVRALRRQLRGPVWPLGPLYRWLIRREILRPRHARATDQALGRRRPCRACESERVMEDYAVHTLARLLADAADWQRFCASDGLCREHTRQLLACLPPDLAARVVDDLLRRLDALAERLRLMFRKLDYRHAGEPRGVEMHAWREALEYHSGWIPPHIRPGAASGNRFSTPLRDIVQKARSGEHPFRQAPEGVPQPSPPP